MAHAARLSTLADGLITSVCGSDGEEAHAKTIHDRTLKGLKNNHYGRTNQFEVKSRLDGLVEKFAVLNRDDLAEGLQCRLDELPEQSKWLPEILSLFLELSDRPLEKTRIDDVEAAFRVEAEQPLTWADIIADDPLDEDGIWNDVERGYHSSDDDFTSDEAASGDDTQATSIVEEDPLALASMHITPIDEELVAPVKATRMNVEPSETGPLLSELHLIRETLSMLRGLPTNIYRLDLVHGSHSIASGVALSTASSPLVRDCLQMMAECGLSLALVRQWTRSVQDTPTIHACQAATSAEMSRLATHISGIEQSYVTPHGTTVASLADLRTEVESLSQPYVTLASCVRAEGVGYADLSIALLDQLYDETCLAQLANDEKSYAVLFRVLYAGLNTYLRSVTRWITAGDCDNSSEFFVVDAQSDCELGRLWHDRYTMRKNEQQEMPSAPGFLQPFAARIFALGKGRAFLRALAREDDEDVSGHGNSDLELQADASGLLPFSQILQDALETWILKHSEDQTSLLRTTILHDQGLLDIVDTLQEVFLSRNGRRFQTFASALFWRLDNAGHWNDGFLLTELAQSTLGTGGGVVAESIAIQVMNDDESLANGTETSVRRLHELALHYRLPWALQNITASPSPSAYSQAFTFLLQIYRAKSILRQHVLALRPLNATHTTQPKAAAQAALALQQRLSNIVDMLHAHLTFTAQHLGQTLQKQLTAAADLDAMAAIWQQHEHELGVSLLVAGTLGPVREAIVSVLELCERLAGGGRFEALLMAADHNAPALDVQAMRKELDGHLSFITAGLRGISRAGGHAALEQLAERIRWMDGVP